MEIVLETPRGSHKINESQRGKRDKVAMQRKGQTNESEFLCPRDISGCSGLF